MLVKNSRKRFPVLMELLLIAGVVLFVSVANAAQYNYEFYDDFTNGYANWSYV